MPIQHQGQVVSEITSTVSFAMGRSVCTARLKRKMLSECSQCGATRLLKYCQLGASSEAEDVLQTLSLCVPYVLAADFESLTRRRGNLTPRLRPLSRVWHLSLATLTEPGATRQ